MNGPIKKRTDFGAKAELLEKWATGFGVVVVAGLLIECVPELVRAALHRSWPSSDVIGNTVVTLGVAGEVILSGVALRATIRADREAEERIATLNAETERLRKENNSIALLLSYRSIGDVAAFIVAMREFAGTKFVIQSVDSETNEIAHFRWELTTSLSASGWKAGFPETRPNLNLGVTIVTVSGSDQDLWSPAADALAEWLDSKSVATITGCVCKPRWSEPGSLIIQLGAKPETIRQHEQIRAEHVRIKLNRPITPPQA